MFGRRRPPAEVRRLIGREERVLAWGVPGPDGAGSARDGSAPPYVVATNLGLWWPDPSPRLIPWHLVVWASWSQDGLTVVEAEVADDLLLVEQPALRAPLADPGTLPPVVKQRVEASVARTQEVQLAGGSARVVGRRVPGRDGLSWWARLSPETLDTADVRAELSQIVARLRAADDARRAAL